MLLPQLVLFLLLLARREFFPSKTIIKYAPRLQKIYSTIPAMVFLRCVCKEYLIPFRLFRLCLFLHMPALRIYSLMRIKFVCGVSAAECKVCTSTFPFLPSLFLQKDFFP